MSSARSYCTLPAPRSSDEPIDVSFLCAVLENLYRKQIAGLPDDGYLREHGEPRCIRNQVQTFAWYSSFLPPSGRILDWGSHHGPDSCLLRAAFGDRFALDGCDWVPPNQYEIFHDFAGLAYAKLKHIIELPYEDNSFDVILGSGVLEHVAMDYESLRELHRILKPDGTLIITYLPNWLSIKEWFRRVIRKKDFHRRLYGLAETSQLLKRTGFYPVHVGAHTFLGRRVLGRWGRFLPGKRFCSTLCFVAKRMDHL